MKKRHIIVLLLTIAMFAFSFWKCMFAWGDIVPECTASIFIRNGGVKISLREHSSNTSWRGNVGWFDSYWENNGYYIHGPEFPSPHLSWSGIDWRFCGFQLVADLSPLSVDRAVEVVFPIWTPLGFYFIGVFWRMIRRRQLEKKGKCLQCKHAFAPGQNQCPECGTSRRMSACAHDWTPQKAAEEMHRRQLNEERRIVQEMTEGLQERERLRQAARGR